MLAFGIIAYEMLTRRSPFALPAFVLAMAAQPIPVPPAIDDVRVGAALQGAVRAALCGDPVARPRVRSVLVSLG